MKKSVLTEGGYDFTNGGYINFENDKLRNESVCRHEAQHAELYSGNTYGLLTLMTDKNKQFDEKSRWISQELFRYMNRMQERIAENVEIISVYAEKGKEEYVKAVEELKNRNRTYYNYFRKLCCVNKKVENGADAEEIMRLLRALGRMALNVAVTEIPFSEMNGPKDLQKFFTTGDNAYRYIPNKRFEVLVDVFFRGNRENEKFELVVDSTIGEFQDMDVLIEIAKNAAEKILSGNPMYFRLIQRIETIGKKRPDFKCEHMEYLINMPFDMDNEKEQMEYVDLPMEKFKLLLQDERYQDHIVRLEHSMGGFEDFHMVTLYAVEEHKIYILCTFNDEEFFEVIRGIPQHVVFIQTKLFRQIKSRIRGLIQQEPVFVLVENSIFYGIEFIRKNFWKGSYTFYRCGKYDVLFVWRRHFVFVGYIIEQAEKDLINIFSEYEMAFVEYKNADFDKLCAERVAVEGMKAMAAAKNYVNI